MIWGSEGRTNWLGGWMFPGVCIAIPQWRDNGKQFSWHRPELVEPRTLQNMIEAAEGQRLNGSPATVVRRICTDSRQVRAGDLFVALKGDRFDGHAFLTDAAKAGAAAILCERASAPENLPPCALVAVKNTRAALGKIAAAYRRDFQIPLVAVAGSNGKTTTKELIGTVLRQKFRTLTSPASFNNDIGVPVTLLELMHDHQVAVLEFGTNHPGELPALLQLATPRYGVLPSIGREHLEFFKNLEGVIQEEGWLGELLPPSGKLFLNGDAPGIDKVCRRSSAPVLCIGFGEANSWKVGDVQFDKNGVRFQLKTPEPDFCRTFHVPLYGRHQAINAALAIAVGAEFGLSPAEIQCGLSEIKPPKMRLQLRTVGQVQLLDDSYNANADSMRAALDTLRDFPCRGRRVAVLGDMAELGAEAAAAHAEIGRYAALSGVEELLIVGEQAQVTAQAAHQAGARAVRIFKDLDSLAGCLHRSLHPGDLVLVKGSRAAGLDRIRELLEKKPPEESASLGTPSPSDGS